YSMIAPTLADSTVAAGQHLSVFFLRAATAAPDIYFDSPTGSGYSLDNLAPGVPTNFAYASSMLSWDESNAADFDYFAVYGSNTNSFASAIVVDYTTGTSMDVSSASYAYFFLTATDFSGNESAPAVLQAPTDVGDAPKRYVLSLSSYPNPFNPATTVSYTVPSRGLVTVAIYDAHGALVTTLVNNEERAPGAYRIGWDGRNDRGASVTSGVYFARIEHGGAARSRKMVLLK
ncbi:MAG TPA: T9SS type A sorting domain-containing protein, partial [Candidatus Krumholzibacteria bacterium]|nr:T9SS type A sorting domain-containing protein [Candidatus Krumholzibacteria bacterium]